MAKSKARTEKLIRSVLLLRGRVEPSDLSALDDAERAPALRAYFEEHHAVEALRFEDDVLVADGAADVSEVDELLGGYAGVEPAEQPEYATPPSAIAEGGPTEPEAAPEKPRPHARSLAERVKSLRFHPYQLWWVPSVLIPMFGGIAAWVVLRHKHEKAARAMLGVGLAAGIIASLLFLGFARQIAGFVTGTTRGEVIKLPATQPGEGGSSSSTTAPGDTGAAPGR